MHSQTFSEEEESEDECPNSAKEQNGGDCTPVFVMCHLETVCSQDDEGDGVSDVSDHKPEEHGKEDRDQDGRVNLLIFGYGHQFGAVLELLHTLSVAELRGNGLEPLLLLLRLVDGPSALLLDDLDIGALDLGLKLVLDEFDLGGGDPRINHEGVVAVRDPERDLSLLDLDGKLLLGSFEEIFVFFKKCLDIFRNILKIALACGEVALDLGECVECGSLEGRHCDLGESAFGKGGKDAVLVLDLGEHGDDVVSLLLGGEEDLTSREP